MIKDTLGDTIFNAPSDVFLPLLYNASGPKALFVRSDFDGVDTVPTYGIINTELDGTNSASEHVVAVRGEAVQSLSVPLKGKGGLFEGGAVGAHGISHNIGVQGQSLSYAYGSGIGVYGVASPADTGGTGTGVYGHVLLDGDGSGIAVMAK